MTFDGFYSGAEGSRIFCAYFKGGESAKLEPAPPKRDVGFVLCNAFASETEIFRVHFVHFARRLAALGFPVLRFDYAGYGDSEGAFQDACPSTMERDIEVAIEALRARAGVERVGLVGLRLGATLAARVAARRPDVDRLVLWEPLIRPWDDIFAELRSTLSMQTVLFKEVKATRDRIVEDVLAGRPTLVGGYDLAVIDDGFPLGKRLVEEARAIDLSKEGPTPSRTLLVNVRKAPGKPPTKLVEYAAFLTSKGIDAKLEIAVEATLPWVHEQTYTTMSPKLYATTLEWMES